jgi:hypothetical protein
LIVRPFGSTAVSVNVHVAKPGTAAGTSAHVPLFVRTSLKMDELTEIGASTAGSMGTAMSGAVSVTMTVVDWPSGIVAGEIVRLRTVVSGVTVSVPLARVTE